MSAAISGAAEVRHSARASESARPRPRVLHLINSFDIGGTERQAVELLKGLDRERFDVRLAVLRNTGPFYSEIEALFPDVPEFPLTSFYNANALKQLARLRRLMLCEKIDILHAHDFYSGLLGCVAARLAGVRVIACQRHLKLSDRKVHELGTRVIHWLAHRVLVNSEAIRERIIEQGSARPEKIVVVRNGVLGAHAGRVHESAAHTSRAEEMWGIASMQAGRLRSQGARAQVVGMVARMQPVKGHKFFIDAAARVAQSQPDVRFVLVGDGPLRPEIEAQVARLGLADRVHLLGDRTDAAKLIPEFDLLVLASLHEGLPNAVMEAMAAGVPVVATAVGGTKELIVDGETGYLVPPADAIALAERIACALANEETSRRVAASGFEFVKDRLSIGRMVASVENLYQELTEGSASFQLGRKEKR